MQGSRVLHVMIKSSLLLTAIFWILIVFSFVCTRALESVIFVDNVAPTVVSDSLDAGQFIMLRSGTTMPVIASGAVEDLNGGEDIENVKAVLYRSPFDPSCAADNNHCYVASFCSLADSGNLNQKIFSCTFNMAYYADATSENGQYPNEYWKLYIEVFDGLARGSRNLTTVEVQDLLSVQFPSSIDFGSVTLGEKAYASFVIGQKGNIRSGIRISSKDSAMDCSVLGSIPIENHQFSTDAFVFGSGITLTNQPEDTGMMIDWQTTDAETGDDVYVGVAIPDEGVEGVCGFLYTLEAYAK